MRLPLPGILGVDDRYIIVGLFLEEEEEEEKKEEVVMVSSEEEIISINTALIDCQRLHLAVATATKQEPAREIESSLISGRRGEG